jgi:hypothetical protein
MLANDGVYDEKSFLEYQRIEEIGQRNLASTIMITQISIHVTEVDFLSFVRNIYLASLRPENTYFDLNTMTMSIPVETDYLYWMETVKENVIFSGYKLIRDEFIKVGPISNKFNRPSYASSSGDGFYQPPTDTPCHIGTLPLQSIFIDYGITDESISSPMQLWIKLKSRAYTLT